MKTKKLIMISLILATVMLVLGLSGNVKRLMLQNQIAKLHLSLMNLL